MEERVLCLQGGPRLIYVELPSSARGGSRLANQKLGAGQAAGRQGDAIDLDHGIAGAKGDPAFGLACEDPVLLAALDLVVKGVAVAAGGGVATAGVEDLPLKSRCISDPEFTLRLHYGPWALVWHGELVAIPVGLVTHAGTAHHGLPVEGILLPSLRVPTVVKGEFQVQVQFLAILEAHLVQQGDVRPSRHFCGEQVLGREHAVDHRTILPQLKVLHHDVPRQVAPKLDLNQNLVLRNHSKVCPCHEWACSCHRQDSSECSGKTRCVRDLVFKVELFRLLLGITTRESAFLILNTEPDARLVPQAPESEEVPAEVQLARLLVLADCPGFRHLQVARRHSDPAVVQLLVLLDGQADELVLQHENPILFVQSLCLHDQAVNFLRDL
mmetsp:Transcript_14369/g.40874  ORF Transcript_14369/g.40874 Transcript_14369/m.40874 type:complete len:384 (-) Transcript_14369:1385-2536(-)